MNEKVSKRPVRFGSVRFIEASVRFPRFGLALGTEPRRFRIVRFGTGSVPVQKKRKQKKDQVILVETHRDVRGLVETHRFDQKTQLAFKRCARSC